MRNLTVRSWTALIVLAFGCGSDESPTEVDPPRATTVELSEQAFALEMGEGLTLSAAVIDQFGNAMSEADVAWSSSNPEVISVDSTGYVEALAGGSATIRASSGSAFDEALGTIDPIILQRSPIAAGGAHACGLSGDGIVHCWGANGTGALGTGSRFPGSHPVPVVGTVEYAQISAGPLGQHTCALSVDFEVYCWGDNREGQVDGSPSSDYVLTPRHVSLPEPVRRVSAARQHTCALTAAGRVWCWGASEGLSPPPAPTVVSETLRFESIDAGRNHTCGLEESGKVYCWGLNQYGGVSPDMSQNHPSPVLVSNTLVFADVAGGDGFTCAATTDGAVYCWGNNGFGQLGQQGAGMLLVPGLADIVSVEAGTHYACAIDSSAHARCWGSNYQGQIGSGSPTPYENVPPTEVVGGHSFAHLALGDEAACGVTTDEEFYCWGSNAQGQLGDGLGPTHFEPVAVSGGKTFTQIFAGGRMTCGIDGASALFCWGGVDGFASMTPAAVAPGMQFMHVDADQYHACALETDGSAYCWGRNTEFGALGNGSSQPSPVPVPVNSDSSFVIVSTGYSHSCAVTPAGNTSCWGDGQRGQFGDGIGWGGPTPVPGALGLAPTKLVTGAYHACALDSSNTASCWGSDPFVLGSASQPDRFLPTPVDGGHAFVTIAAGAEHTCALDTAGAPWCWGRGSGGKTGAAGPTRTPREVGGSAATFESIAAGYEHTCAAAPNGTVYCWGSNGAGELGRDDLHGTSVPTEMPFDAPLHGVVAGNQHSCALTETGAAYCWGYNLAGQLGVPVTVSSNIPLAVVPF